LHARTLYVCILDNQGNVCLHKAIPGNPELLYQLLKPYIGNIVVGVECMHCWYWVADYCEDIGVDLKGHVVNTTSQYNLPVNKVNLKNISAREQLKSTFPDPIVQRTIELYQSD
tara:strand:- start:28 stop:369 length:342 start_codon:yes stop_codon:yes gene_type:complete